MFHRLVPVVLLMLFSFGCAEQRDPADIDIKSHPPEWSQVGHPDFHGTRVVQDGPATCQSCHGVDYRGDGRASSCYECHDGPSGHPANWTSRDPKPFHGDAVIANEGPQACAACHGEDYKGGWSGVSCDTCHDGPSGHPRSWLVPDSPYFHGLEVAHEGTDHCMACHGNDLRGGWTGVSCSNSCHPGPSGHPMGWDNPGSPNFHGIRVASDGVDLCRLCHGEDLMGGTAGISCTSGCHDGPGGHPTGWVNPSSPNFHAIEVILEGSERCKACHGEDLLGGWSGVSCSNACHDMPVTGSGPPSGQPGKGERR